MKIEFSELTFGKYSNVKFHKNPSSGSSVIPYRRKDGQTEMAKLIVVLRNVAKKAQD
jgi:hypothetical protein